MNKKQNYKKDISFRASSPLAIIGIGCLFPKAGNVDEYWSNIREGVDAITDIPESHWNPEDYFDTNQKTPDMTYARRGGFIDPVDFNPLQYGMSPNNIEATDTTQLLGMVVARQALLDAGYSTGEDAGDGRDFDRDRTSVIMGVTGTLELVIPLGARLGHPIWRQALVDAGVDSETTEDVIQRISDSYVPWQENSFPGLLGNVSAGRIANRFNLGGTNCVVDAACASSLSAIHMASLELASGRSDMAIAGGLDTFNDIFMYMCFSKTPALSPTGNSRPFALGGDGTIIGEGMGVIILKRLDDAARDNDHIYAVIKGIGTSSDGRGNAIYAPNIVGQTKALKDAYAQASITPDSIELIEAHGTGTSVGDAVEVEALENVYRQANEDAAWCALGSVKSMIGHTKSAAGIAGMIKAVMALKHKVLPPTIKVDQPLESLMPGKSPMYVNTIKRPWVANESHPRRAALSAFGFGGSNFHCVLEEAENDDAKICWDGHVLLFAFSADVKEELSNKLTNIDINNSWSEHRAFAAKSCAEFDAKKTYRLTFIIEKNKTDIQALIQNAIKMLAENNGQDFWKLPIGVSYACGSHQHKIGLLFPGQGTQYVGMLRDLACQFPQFNTILNTANTVKGENKHGTRLSDAIYPVPAFSDGARQEQEEFLRDTRNAQPSIGAVSLSGLRILEAFGFKADITAGHSYGELVALCAAGVFDEKALHQLSLLRGELMAENQDDRGSMLAISACLETVEKFIKDEKLDLVIANHNAPKQIVVSGATNQIEKASGLCKQQKLRATQLPVAAAFHSKFVASAEAPFAAALAKIKLNQGTIPVLSNTTANEYSDDEDDIRQMLKGQMTAPVKFVKQIEKMETFGVRTFVEVGPGNSLSGLVQSILDKKHFQVLSLDASSGKRHGQYDLANLLTSLAVLDKGIDLSLWDAGYLDSLNATENENSGSKKPVMTMPLSGANYVMPREKRPAKPKQVTTQKIQRQVSDIKPDMNQSDLNQFNLNKPAFKQQAITVQSQDTLRATQESIIALQKMQEQTAKLHRQYLQGQEIAQQTITQLLLQQQALLGINTQNVSTSSNIQEPNVQSKSFTPVQLEPDAPMMPKTVKQGMSQNIPVAEIIETEKAADANKEVNSILLDVVAEKTGYPLEMLSLDMSLDTDLGIDSIKRVEILSALQEKLPSAPAIKPEELGTFQLLENIVDFLVSTMPKTAVPNLVISENVPAVLPATPVLNEALNSILLKVVAEKTGYPKEMLGLEMSLDTDLGIDSIKRVEIFSALQEQIPKTAMISPENLGNLQTLQQIADFLSTESTAIRVRDTTIHVSKDNSKLAEIMLDIVAEQTGYPVDMLNLDMNLEADLGIDSIKRVEILSRFQERMPEIPAVKPEDLGTLQTLQQIVDHILKSTKNASLEPEPYTKDALEGNQEISSKTINTIERQILSVSLFTEQQKLISLGKGATVWVTEEETKLTQAICKSLKQKGLNPEIVSLDATPDKEIAGLIILTPANPEQTFMRDSFKLVQRISKPLRATAESNAAILASVTKLGGQFGLNGVGDVCPVSGGIAGLIKTADKEWPEIFCKVIDIENSGSKQLASNIVNECLSEGPLEVGLLGGKRFTPELNTTWIDKTNKANTLNSKDVVVVTGGARGVTAEVALALAETYQTNLLLLGRSKKPDTEDEWLNGLNTEADIKKAILVKENQGMKPKALNTACQKILAAREIRSNLQRIEATGVKVIYRAVDVQEKDSVIAAINETRQSLGTISGFVHGAGVLADKLIEDKTEKQFSNVYATKVAGLDSLLTATEDDSLKIMVMFSSSTGRFGRKGQCDYACANEVLNKVAQQQANLREDCRVVSVNWGPWNGGMVTPQLKKIFEREGINAIDLKIGAEYLMQEIAYAGPAEVVVLGSLTKNPDIIKKSVPKKEPSTTSEIPAANVRIAFSRTLNVRDHAFLQSHVMNGRAVLPAVMIIEWFAHGAMHDNPTLSFHGFRNFQVYKGATLGVGENIYLQILTGDIYQEEDKDIIPVELRSGKILHARAEVILTDCQIKAETRKNEIVSGKYSQSNNEIYTSGRLFHGKTLQGIIDIEACSDTGISAKAKSATTPKTWMKNPIRSSWLADPLVLDGSFQLMILWCFEQFGAGSLPTAIGTYRQFQKSFPKEGCKININVISHTKHRALANIEFIDINNQLIARLDNYECVVDASLQKAFANNKLQCTTV